MMKRSSLAAHGSSISMAAVWWKPMQSRRWRHENLEPAASAGVARRRAACDADTRQLSIQCAGGGDRAVAAGDGLDLARQPDAGHRAAGGRAGNQHFHGRGYAARSI